MEWFKWLIFSYFVVRTVVELGRSVGKQGKTAVSCIIAAILLALMALGVYVWL